MSSIEKLWLMNTHHETVSIPMMDVNPPRIQHFRPNRPLPFPRSIGLKYMNRFRTIKIVEDPAPFLATKKFSKLVIRDMGLGDLILLEPVLRAMAEQGQEITLMTAYPQVFENNPAIYETILMREHQRVPYNAEGYDDCVNLMGAAESHPKKTLLHRTDVFALAAETELKDKEPRFYFKIGKPSFERKPKKKYIGIQLDANANFRKYPEPLARELIEYILAQDENNVVVIIGRRSYIRPILHKNVIDLQGNMTLKQCFNTVAALDTMVACDSGLLHVALTMHVPTVAWFSIINPDYRLRYYTGPKSVVVKNLSCRPCGDGSAGECKFGDASTDPDFRIPKFIHPCAKIEPKVFYEHITAMPKSNGPLVYKNAAIG